MRDVISNETIREINEVIDEILTNIDDNVRNIQIGEGAGTLPTLLSYTNYDGQTYNIHGSTFTHHIIIDDANGRATGHIEDGDILTTIGDKNGRQIGAVDEKISGYSNLAYFRESLYSVATDSYGYEIDKRKPFDIARNYDSGITGFSFNIREQYNEHSISDASCTVMTYKLTNIPVGTTFTVTFRGQFHGDFLENEDSYIVINERYDETGSTSPYPIGYAIVEIIKDEQTHNYSITCTNSTQYTDLYLHFYFKVDSFIAFDVDSFLVSDMDLGVIRSSFYHDGESYSFLQGGGGGTSDLDAIELTYAEYQALTPAEKTDPDKIYFITDYPSGNMALDDLTDVDITTPTEGQILTYDDTDDEWKNTDVDDIAPTVTEASTRANIATGDTLKTIIGKIKKFFSDLKAVAFSGAYSDLSGTPTIPTITDTYSGTSSDGMSGKAVKSAIDALDGTVSGSAGAGKTLTAFSQTDGKVTATFGDISITKSQVSNMPTKLSDFTDDLTLLKAVDFSDGTAYVPQTEHLSAMIACVRENNANVGLGSNTYGGNILAINWGNGNWKYNSELFMGCGDKPVMYFRGKNTSQTDAYCDWQQIVQGHKGVQKYYDKQTVDLSSLDVNIFYPVTGTPLNNYYVGYVHMTVFVALNSGTVPSWSTHERGFSVFLDILNEAQGWGATKGTGICLENDFGWCGDVSPCGYSQMTNSSTPVFWCRGGGKYFIFSDHPMAWSVRTSTYTVSGQSVAPRSTNPGVSFSRVPDITANITGNATSATKATQDGDGNTISSTYTKVRTTTDSANYNTTLNISAYDATKPIFGYVSVITNLSAGANFYIPFSFMKDVVPAGTHNCMGVQGAYSFLFQFTDSPRSIKMVQARDANGNDATTNNTIKFYLYRNY